MGLFKPKWAREDLKGEKLGDAIFFVWKMTSQGKLLEVALRAHNWQVRNQAIERLDEDGLKKVALLSPNGEAAEKAIFRIGDQAFLARVALGQESVASERAMAAAAIRIEDQELLATVARTSPDADARVAAADRMTNPVALLDIAGSERDPDTRGLMEEIVERKSARLEAAKLRPGSPGARETLLDAFANGKGPARLEAAEHMDEETRRSDAVQGALAEMVRDKWTGFALRERAAALLSGPEKSRQYMAALFAVKSADRFDRDLEEAAASLDCWDITDPEVVDFVLDRAVAHDVEEDGFARKALEGLYANLNPNSERTYGAIMSPRLFKDVEKQTEWPEWALLNRVTDAGVLRRIAREHPYPYFRWRACEMAGGHELGENCRCGLCGFEDHSFPSFDVGATCGKCASTIVRRGNGEPTHSWKYNLVDVIEYPDGSTSGINFLYFIERWPDVRPT